MKKSIPLYLVFFGINYFLMKNLSIRDIVILSGCFLVIIAIVFFGLFKFIKERYRAAFLTVIFFGWALYYGSAAQVLQNILHIEFTLIYFFIFLLVWSGLFLLVGNNWIWKKFHPGKEITTYLNLVTIATFLFYGYRVGISETHTFFSQAKQSDNQNNVSVTKSYQPDIYYIILDGYGRADMLRDLYGYDNSEFVNFLTDKGFYVASQSHSNYLHTALSISSSLNMNYINGLPGYQVRTSLMKELISNNQARSFLEQQGYRFATFSSGVGYTDITNSDLYFTTREDNTDVLILEAQVLPSTIAAIPLAANLISPGNLTYRDVQQRIDYTIDQMGKISLIQGPIFVFAHILIPHPPYIYDQNGPITPDNLYSLVAFSGSEESKKAYIDQMIYLNSMVEGMINDILENSEILPIIIIQGDHGPGAYFNNQIETSCLYERASNLNAYYFPSLTDNPLYETITPVNTFRVIFNEYFGTQYEILEDKVYYSSGDAAYKFTDVTKEAAQSCQIP